MKIRYFQDTDTLYIEFKPTEVSETRDMDENTLLDLDKDGTFVELRSSTREKEQTSPISLSSKWLCSPIPASNRSGMLGGFGRKV